MDKSVDQEKKERTGVNLRVNEADKLYFDIWYRGEHNRKYTGLPNTTKNRERCEKVKELILREMELVVFALSTFDITKYLPDVRQRRNRVPTPVPQDRTVRGFGESEWYEHKRATSETKAKEYLGDLNIITETVIEIGGKKVKFGDIKLRQMRPEYVDQLTNTIKQRPGRKKAVVGGARLTVLLRKVTRSVHELAYERELMPKNPHGWFKSQRKEKVDVDPFSLPEMVAFLNALPTREWRRYFTVAFGTGLGPSEQFALGWEHVDFEGKLILVRQGIVKGRLTLLKTDSRRREIDMFPHVEQALREQREATSSGGLYVFPNSKGGPLHLDNVRHRVWYPTMARAGLRPRELYQTRHTFASQLLSRSADIPWVSRLMGHANTKMVILRYWKFIRNRSQQDGRDYVAEIQQAMGGMSSENHP